MAGRKAAPSHTMALLALLSLAAVAQAATPAHADLRELRRHQASRPVDTEEHRTDVLGRRDIPGGSPAAAPYKAAANITLPFSIDELAAPTTSPAPAPHMRRSLLAAPLQCRSRPNVTFSGGGLAGDSMRLKDVQTAAACCGRCHALPNCVAWTWSSRTKICYPKHARGWVAQPLKGVVSGQVIRASPPPPPSPPPPGAPQPWWEGNLHVGDDDLAHGFAEDVQTVRNADHKSVVVDPTGNTSLPVIKTIYNKGCWSPQSDCGGGALFYAWPHGKAAGIGEAARLEYEVFFPEGFPWIKGGKLPGLSGGNIGCSGGASAEDCFSVRIMWRREGYGEAYLYVPNAQDPGFCKTPGTVCDYAAGFSLNRGAFRFRTGQWTKIAVTVRMNDVGKKNGLVQVDVDGAVRIHYDKLVWRNRDSLSIDALMFATWFGGSDASWAPTRTVESYWRNFRIYKL